MNNWAKELAITISARDKTGAGFASVEQRIASLKDTASRLGGVLAGLGAGVSMIGLLAVVRSVVNELDRTNKSAQKVGVSVEGFSALEYAAGQSGVEVQALETALGKLSKTAVEAARGGKEPAAAFEALGVEVRDGNGHLKTADKLLLDLAEAFAQFEDGPAKSELAMRLFGKAGADLIPLLNQGRDGITALMEEARRLGVVLDGDAAAAAERLNDNLSRVAKSMRGLAVAAAEDVLPAIADISDAMAEAAKDGGPIKAFWVGLGGAFDQIVNGTDLTRLKAKRTELEAEIARLKKLVNEGSAPIPFTPFRVQFNQDALAGYVASLRKAEAELADVNRRVDAVLNPAPKPKPQRKEPEPSPLIEAKQKELSDLETVSKAQERVLAESTRDLERALREREQVAREFAALTAKVSTDPNKEVSRIDLEGLLRTADMARAAGEVEKALELARQAGELVRRAQAQGESFTESELTYYARRAGQVADAVMADRQAKAEATREAAKQDLEMLLARAKGLEALPLGLKVDPTFAEGAIKAFHQAMQQYLNDHPLEVRLASQTPSPGDAAIKLTNLAARASGGPIFGPGGPTDDRVLAMLSSGEHVLTAAEVRAAGGHDSIYRMRHALKTGKLPAFAYGGAVAADAAAQAPARAEATRKTESANDIGQAGFQNIPYLGRIDLGIDGKTYEMYAEEAVRRVLHMAALKHGRRK